MKLKQLLNESIRQYELDDLIADIRNNYMFYVERGLKGSSVFEEGKCYEFALALFKFLRSIGEQPELIFLTGNMKKGEAEWYSMDDLGDFDPTQEHPFHTVVRNRKFFFDINGKLGNKREIVAMWPKFRRKKVVRTSVRGVNKYIKDQEIVKDLQEIFTIFYKDKR